MVGRLIVALAFSASSWAQDHSLPWPEGWTRFGDAHYEVGVVELSGPDSRALLIASASSADEEFAAVGQAIDAAPYRGARIRLTGLMKTQDATEGAGLWMRIDGPAEATPRVQAFDNMANRAVTGNSRWARYDVVLDVSDAAQTITFGALLRGSGKVWVDEMSLEAAGDDTEVTAMPIPDGVLKSSS